ncbi:unnamed protein product [Brachionus calyciflorus]|uniref:Uncharacterized protein n=1 Tax=Brachionus calyciflorus TaxID=104777 RepID=A0A813MTU8_9BILA|nr:unnamed protein product [Brachionus calyciflorus]
MLKIVLLLISFGLCLTKVPLRDPQYWTQYNSGHAFDLLNEWMGGFNFGVDQLKQDDYLTQLAQSVADMDGNPHNFINSYTKDSDLNVLVFGIKLNGSTSYKQILTENFDSVMEGMPGYLNFRYKNNTLNVELNQLKQLMDITRCDTLTVPLNCDENAVKNLWRTGTGVFKFQNDNYNYQVKFNNMLKVFESMADDRKDRYSLDIFKDTYSQYIFKNENYEMTFDAPDLFGPGFWSKDKGGVWGLPDQIVTILTHGGNIRATSDVQHQFLKVHLEINEPFVTPNRPNRTLTDEELRDEIESHFRTMYEMFDRDQVFKSFSKYGQGYGLDSDGNINIFMALSSQASDDVRFLDRQTRLNLFNRLKKWPWFAPAAPRTVKNPFDKKTMIETWTKALQLSMGPINEDRRNDGLSELKENSSVLTKLAQDAADLMAQQAQFTSPDFSSVSNSQVLIVAVRLGGTTKINEFSFIINENNFGQVTCFDNFSNVKHRVANIIDNERYICSKNSKSKELIEKWKKYSSYGTGQSFNSNGDSFLTIALSDVIPKSEF